MQRNRFRIISGQWRGRKLSFADAKGLRPTLDRVKETVFNWVQHDIYNSRCLDLFSGSGSLSFEALSRGAESVFMVDSNQRVCRQLQHNLDLLDCHRGRVIHQNALDFIQQADDQQRFDVVFMDPPFQQNLLISCCRQLQASSLLAADALLYLECEKDLDLSAVTENWLPLKQKQSGQLAYYLFQYKM